MPRLLLIKTSSLGDVVHALPVLTDLGRYRPDWVVDWMVEESFQSLPGLHPRIGQIVPVATRRWRKQLGASSTWKELKELKWFLTDQGYDAVLDLQGLIKSAILGLFCPAPRHGYAWASAREPLASCSYHHRHSVPWTLHAVERNRRLAGLALGYEPLEPCDYGLAGAFSAVPASPPYVIFLHATSRADKLWPEERWITLGRWFYQQGYRTLLPSGSNQERLRGARLAREIPASEALPALDLNALAGLISAASFVVGVDTGLTHLATALNRPVVALYTATNPDATGVHGNPRAVNLGGIDRMPTVETVIEQFNFIGK